MPKSRKPTEQEFKDAEKYGIPISIVDKEKCKVIGDDILFYDSNGSLVRNTTLMAISRDYSEAKKRKEKEAEKNAEKILWGLAFILLIVMTGAGIFFYQKAQERQRESQIARKDYINRRIRNPVAKYQYTNQVFDEIESNKVRFKNEKNGKIIHVTGYIAKGGIRDTKVSIDGYGALLPPKITCNIMPEFKDKLSELSAGQTILIAGIVNYDDTPWDHVDLDHCMFFTNVDQRGSLRMWDIVEPLFRY